MADSTTVYESTIWKGRPTSPGAAVTGSIPSVRPQDIGGFLTQGVTIGRYPRSQS